MAQRSGRVCVGEFHAIVSEGVDVRSDYFGLGIETGRIAVAHVIDENDHDVGFGATARG